MAIEERECPAAGKRIPAFLCLDLRYGLSGFFRETPMRIYVIIAAVLCLLCGEAAATPKQQVIAKGMGPVPGAIVCPDFGAVQAAFRGFSSWRRPPPEYFGCTVVPPGEVMTLEGEDPGGAPVVSALLPNGTPVRGVTLHDMVESFAPKPRKAAVRPAKPAPAESDAAAKPSGVSQAATANDTSLGSTPLPEIKNSPDTLCEATHPCNDQEFTSLLAALEKRWALMPDWLQKKCTANSTIPAMEQCIASETASWSNAHPEAETPWMGPQAISQ